MIELLKSKLLFKFILRSIVLLFVSIGCIEYLTYQKTGQLFAKQISSQQQRAVASQAGHIQNQLTQLQVDTKIITQLPAVEDLLLNTQYDLKEEVKRITPLIENFVAVQSQRNQNYQQFGICDKDGQLLFLFPQKSKPFAKVNCQSEAGLNLFSHGEQSILSALEPIYRNSQQIGSAFILLNISSTFNRIATEHIFDTGFWALFDQDNQLLTRLENRNQFFAKHLSNEDIQTLQGKRQTINEQDVFVYTRQIAPVNWRLYAVVYTNEMFAQLLDILYLITIVVLCVFVVEVVFLSYFTNALVLQPINRLLTATKHILRGNFGHTIKVKSNDEIGKLTGSFNQMIQTVDNQLSKLRSLNQELKLIYSIFESGKEGIVVADSQWRIIDINRAFIQHFGFSKADLAGHCALELMGAHQEVIDALSRSVEDQGNWQGEVLLYAKSGKDYAQLCSVNRVIDELYQTTHHILLFSDISQLKETQSKLEKLAHYDELTGLFNRYQFNISVHLAIDEAQANQAGFALFFIDLDNFKYINDTMGHDVGDGFLQQVATRLKKVTRTSDIVSRFGGDEFVLLLKNLTSQQVITQLADKIREVLNTKFVVYNKEIYASASIGIALYPQDGEVPADLLKAADIAMYSAKDSGKNAYQFFMPEMNLAIAEKLNVEEHLSRGLQNDEFEFYYQPKHHLLKQNEIAAEALIRWHKGGTQLVGPNEFIAMAEESGLIVPISYQVFEKGCIFINTLKQHFDANVQISFNLSGRQFRQHDLAHQLADIAQRHHIPTEQIEFEITESVIMADPELAKVICQQIKGYGFRLSLDDFGTGYSSLSYIRDYPIDCIKVDRSFVTGIESNITNQAIISAVLSIADSLSLEVLCEGVETESQLAFLNQMGVSRFQGYYFSKPLRENDFLDYLQERQEVKQI